MLNSKQCECCGSVFHKRARDSQEQWLKRAYCSMSCSNKSRPIKPPHIAFWENVEVAEGNKCWIWRGSMEPTGYGKIGFGGVDSKREFKAHRVSYEMRYGPIKDGMVICHTCDNPSCVNPNHLFEGTHTDNMRDMGRKGRVNPNSILNLRPGQKGVHGAGPKSQREIQCQDQ